MNRLKRLPPLLVGSAACFLVLAQAGSFWAQEKKHDGKELRESLKEVINYGADLFNKYGDHAGCYRMYQGALISIKPYLAPEMQKQIDDAIADAEKLPRFSDRAFALRKQIDDVRAYSGQLPPPPPGKKILEKLPYPTKKPQIVDVDSGNKDSAKDKKEVDAQKKPKTDEPKKDNPIDR